MLLLPLPLPVFQQLDDCILHPLWRVRAREIFAENIAGKRDVTFLRLLLLGQDFEHDVIVQLTRLAELLHALCLRKRRCCLFALNGIKK